MIKAQDALAGIEAANMKVWESLDYSDSKTLTKEEAQAITNYLDYAVAFIQNAIKRGVTAL